MDKVISVTCDENNLNENNGVILNIQKAIFATLLEGGKIDMSQYEFAVKLLEKNFLNDNFSAI